jgi:hypothetical protein
LSQVAARLPIHPAASATRLTSSDLDDKYRRQVSPVSRRLAPGEAVQVDSRSFCVGLRRRSACADVDAAKPGPIGVVLLDYRALAASAGSRDQRHVSVTASCDWHSSVSRRLESLSCPLGRLTTAPRLSICSVAKDSKAGSSPRRRRPVNGQPVSPSAAWATVSSSARSPATGRNPRLPHAHTPVALSACTFPLRGTTRCGVGHDPSKEQLGRSESTTPCGMARAAPATLSRRSVSAAWVGSAAAMAASMPRAGRRHASRCCCCRAHRVSSKPSSTLARVRRSCRDSGRRRSSLASECVLCFR